MHASADQTSRAMPRHRFGGGLLQRLVGEQPVPGAGEFGRGLAPQHRRFHQHRGVHTETFTRPSDIGDQGGIGQRARGDLAQRLRSGAAAQVTDVLEAELQDGLTPVTITL